MRAVFLPYYEFCHFVMLLFVFQEAFRIGLLRASIRVIYRQLKKFDGKKIQKPQLPGSDNRLCAR